jgi:UDP-N-acetylglucosamine 2-epimerase (non-hydrolysing)
MTGESYRGSADEGNGKMIAVVLGTRPEVIKCAPVILEAERRNIPIGIIHTGQHYTRELDEIFFEELNLPKPVAHIHTGSHAAPKQIGIMMQRLAETLESIRPRLVMVEGDVNSVLGGALAAYKSGIPVAHIEAGLRSDDWTMPEESNRVLTDRISRWLFCPTDLQRERLRQEGIDHGGVHVVGNTVVDAALHYSKVAYEKSDIAERLGIHTKRYALLTMHRPHNVDDPQRLRAMIDAIGRAADCHGLSVVFPVHPRTQNSLQRHRIRLDGPFVAIDPVGYLDLLRLQCAAEIVLTDSGGIQEEACILRVPSITLRPNTERPETIAVGASILHDAPDADMLAAAIERQMALKRDWPNPFGDGNTARMILDIFLRDGMH